MAVAIEIRRASQAPTSHKSWAVRGPDKNIIVQIPDRRLSRASVLKHVVRMTVAVKVGEDGSRRSRSSNCCLQSVERKALSVIASRAGNRLDRRAKPITVPHELAIARVYEAVGAD